MEKITLIILLSILVIACKKEQPLEELVKQRANECFEQLIRDPQSDVAKMWILQEDTYHGGIQSFDIQRVTIDTLHHQADAYIELTYGAQGKEVILVPLIEENGEWKLK